MTLLQTFITLCVLVATLAQARPATTTSQPASRSSVRFVALNVFIDAQDRPLAAYQFELTAPPSQFTIVGVEGGEHKAFITPPYYDPAALSKNRIILAAFNTGKDLPTGKARVARIHARIVGDNDPDYRITLRVAATTDGRDIPATVTIAQGAHP